MALLLGDDTPIKLVSRAAGKGLTAKAKPTKPRPASVIKTKPGPKKKFVAKLLAAAAAPSPGKVHQRSDDPHRASIIRLGSDCSGYGSEFLAMQYVGLPVKTVFCSEIDPDKVTLLRRAHAMFEDNAFTLYPDIKQRDNKSAPECDIFVSGAPCQAYSAAGKGAGLDDMADRGITLFYSLDYVRHKKPPVVILENVRGLTFKKHAHVLADIVSVLTLLGYKITKRVCNTRDHGIPQSRPRLYIIAIRKSCHVHKFPWPSPVKAPPLLRFVDSSKAKKDSINALGATALANVLYWRRVKKQAEGIDILALPYVLDVGASPKFRCIMWDCSPCLTKSRAGTGGHFITCLRRTMTIADIGRLQGAPTALLNALVEAAGGDTSKVGRALGDAMSINVLMRLLPRALWSAGVINALPLDIWSRTPPRSGILPDALYARGSDTGDPL